MLKQAAFSKIDTVSNMAKPFNMPTKVLVIDDEVLFARAVVKRLQKAGYACEHAENISDSIDLARQFMPDLVLLDMRLPDGNGLTLLGDLLAKGIAVIMMTAHGEVSDAVAAIKQGALDYLKKPMDLEELLLIVQKSETVTRNNSSLDYSRQRSSYQAKHPAEGVAMLGNCPAIQEVRAQILRITQLTLLEDVIPPTVMITGETGTGKDVAARLLHLSCQNKNQANNQQSHYLSDKPFVHIDCASLPTELIESELFGHEKGAFTSAVGLRPGLIEAAEDGTLFLDEIGELPLTLQAKLLNVLERRVVRRIGSNKERPVKARIIAATNRDLLQMVSNGSFRSDLYYRLNVLNMYMPPLRERHDKTKLHDAVLLAQHFAKLTERRYGLQAHVFSELAMQAIAQYAWPGNVRELRHQISRAVLLSQHHIISVDDLALPTHKTADQNIDSDALISASKPNDGTIDRTIDRTAERIPEQVYFVAKTDVQPTLDDIEKTTLLNTLAHCKYNVSKAARILGITRMAMRYRMDKHGISD